MIAEANKKTVNSVLDSQRKDGEARSLLQDLEKLISLKGERKLRWVWELIQNAKDCSVNGKKVNIDFILTKDKVIFQHDGEPFQIEHLIALARKTSTKSIEGLDGNTGKFGTGFVTTHVLNRQVTVSGLLQNEDGCRPFSLLIDRSFDTLSELKKSLEATYEKIDEINARPSTDDIYGIKTTYEYLLEDYKFTIAKDGLKELEKNLPFTLLINSEQLQSVTITDENSETLSFAIDTPIAAFSEIGFSKITKTGSNDKPVETGLLFAQNNSLTIAFPATSTNGTYSLSRITEQARIFRDFPLIGTERFHVPCFIHSNLFQPTEPRDGIRTLKDIEERPDKHADENREALKMYIELFKATFTELSKNKVSNLHLLAESGMPDDTQNYIAKEWFTKVIQKPLRDFLLEHDLVKNVDGHLIRIQSSKFIKTLDFENEAELYNIVSELYPSNCPDKDSFPDWKIIIGQDEDLWVDDIHIEIDNVVKEVEEKQHLHNLKIKNISPIEWLNKLITYIQKIGKIELTEQFAIYPSQSKEFKKRLDLRLDPRFDSKLKDISKNIFRNLYDELILDDIQNQEGIQKFDTSEFFASINNAIGALDCNKASEEQTNAIFELGCYFKKAPAKRRTEWFELTNTLVPQLATKKLTSNSLDEFVFEPADKWTLKYVCLLIEKSEDFATFSKTYFQDNPTTTYDWLNRFLTFVCRNEDGRDTAFKYSIVLTQDGNFKKYEGNLFREDKPEDFEVLFKDLIKNYIDKGDPRGYLIDTRITCEQLAVKGADFLTDQIDRLFNEPNIEQAVEDGGKFNSLFHKLNDWYTKDEEKNIQKPKNHFPIFKGKRPDLSVRAYGKEMSKIMAEKGMEEIKALTKLKLKSSELNQLEEAATLAGGTQILLTIAQGIHEEAERIRWRKEVGRAAENAFLEAMEDIETKFDIENPDVGKDFTIISKTTGKEFYIEIKSTVIGEETVKMSSLQGLTANQEKERYALCVITRPSGTLIDKEYFLQNVNFISNIGELIGDKITTIVDDLKTISEHEKGDVNVSMDNKAYSVYISKKIWEDGIRFNDFINLLKTYLLTT
jgi:hypothetical protein